jgi:hypothetical protein
METHPNSKLEPTNWDHRHLTFPNRNNKTLFAIHEPNSNRQLETIRNRLNPFTIMQMTFSNRPKKTKVAGGLQRQFKGSRRDASGTKERARLKAAATQAKAKEREVPRLRSG